MMVIDGLLVFLVCDVDLFVCVIVALASACRALACRTLGVVVCVLALWMCCGERLGMTVVWSRVCGVCGVGGAVEAMLTCCCVVRRVVLHAGVCFCSSVCPSFSFGCICAFLFAGGVCVCVCLWLCFCVLTS